MQLTFNDTFAPKYGGKLFKVKPAQLAYSIDVDADAMTPEGQELKKLTERLWKKEMDHFRSAKEKEYAEIILVTEKNIYKSLAKRAQKQSDPKKLETWLIEEAKGANVLIKNAIKTLQSLVSDRAQKVYEAAAKAVDKKFKSHLRSMKVKAGLKILGHVTLILVAGALAIAAAAAGVALTAATLGAGAVSFAVIAPAVASAVGVIAKSGKSIYDTVQKEWPKCEKSLEQLEKATKSLIKSVEYQQKKKVKKDLTGKLGPKERLKLMMNDIKGDVKSVEKNIVNCNAFAVTLSQKVELLAREVTKLQKPIDDLNAAPDDKDKAKVKGQAQKLVTQQVNMIQKITKARSQLKELKPLLLEGQRLVKSTDLEDVTKLKGFLGKVQKIATDESVQAALVEGKQCLVQAAGLVKIMAKF